MSFDKNPQLRITADDCDSTIEHYETLLKQGWNPADKFFLSDTLFGYPTRWCQRSGTEEEKIGRLRWLIAHGADVNAVDGIDETPLKEALSHEGEDKVVQFLIDSGADLDLCGVLWDVCYWRDMKYLEWYLSLGADVNAVDEAGNTALSRCCDKGYTKKVRLLLKHGADPTILNNQGQNCLMGECTKKSLFPSLVELVCPHGVDITQTADEYPIAFDDVKDWGLAEFQAHYGHFENVLWLLDRADYKHKDLPHLTKIAKLASYSKKGTEVLIYCLEHGVALTDGMIASIKNSKNKAILNYLQEHGEGR